MNGLPEEKGFVLSHKPMTTSDGQSLATYTKKRARGKVPVIAGAAVIAVATQYGMIGLGASWDWVGLVGLGTFSAAIYASRYVYRLRCPGCGVSLPSTGVLLSCPSCEMILAAGSTDDEKDAVTLKGNLRNSLEKENERL